MAITLQWMMLVLISKKESFRINRTFRLWKTTTLKMINRLIPLSEGYIYFKDKPISDYPVYEMRWDIGYVLQQIALFPHMTIKENIAQVPQMKKWKDKDIDLRVNELLEMVGLDPEIYKIGCQKNYLEDNDNELV